MTSHQVMCPPRETGKLPTGQTLCWCYPCESKPEVRVTVRLQDYPVAPSRIWVCREHARSIKGAKT